MGCNECFFAMVADWGISVLAVEVYVKLKIYLEFQSTSFK